MSELDLHHTLVIGTLIAAGVTFAALVLISAPYGRHARSGWGPTIPARVAWIAMESPAVIFFIAVYLQGAHRFDAVPLVLLGLWQLHYVNRTFVFPFRMRATGKRMPVLMPLLALVFNCVNAYINARWISHLGAYDIDWGADPRFALGAVVFLAGWFINVQSDQILLSLRKPGESGYRIPRGGMYRWISCPNYFGEILEWTGWAIATWSLPGVAFAVYTFANLAPRAYQNHRWYREQFPDYPASRRPLVPFV